MNRNIIIVLIIIFLIILAGIITFSQFATKEDSQLSFISNASLKNGDSVEFQLTDAQGNALANQNLSITFGTNGNYEHYSIVTDSAGRGSLLINDVNPGNYNVTVKYAGDERYNECSASQNITIGGEIYETGGNYTTPSGSTTNTPTNGAATQSSASSAQSSPAQSTGDTSYDSELNVYYDSNGKVVGGQNDGADYNDLKTNQPSVDENGNLV